MGRTSVLTLVVVALVGPCLPAKILYINPLPAYSHVNPFMPVFKELAARGHSVTMVTTFPQDPKPKNFHEINVNLTLATLEKTMWSDFGGKQPSPRAIASSALVFQLMGMPMMCPDIAPLLVEKAKEAMPPPASKFDLVILEPFFCMEPLIALSHFYGAPVVLTMAVPLNYMAAGPTGNTYSFANVPDTRLSYSNNMNVFERAWNTFVGIVGVLVNNLYYLPKQDKLMREIFNRPDLPYIGDLLQNISLSLVFSHHSLNYPRPLLKNVVEIGGASTETVKPLPKELQKYLDEAKDGAILFSWGSHYKASDSDKIVENLMVTFSKLKQRVIFKWDNHSIPNKPDNVLLQKWVPQPGILNHKNTVLFISHCGLNSIFEATYFGVPVVGTPVFGDQMYNTKLLEHFGMAIEVSPLLLEEDSVHLTSAINRILSDSSFKENAVKRSKVMKDRPMSALDEAVYWVEYILRHGGKDLRPPLLPWYSLALLDVTLFFLGILMTPVALLYWCIRKLCCRRSCSKFDGANKKKRD